jgi:hypothetical protein
MINVSGEFNILLYKKLKFGTQSYNFCGLYGCGTRSVIQRAVYNILEKDAEEGA